MMAADGHDLGDVDAEHRMAFLVADNDGLFTLSCRCGWRTRSNIRDCFEHFDRHAAEVDDGRPVFTIVGVGPLVQSRCSCGWESAPLGTAGLAGSAWDQHVDHHHAG